MSKLVEKLGRIYKTSPPAIGFRKFTEEADLPALLLMADLSKAGGKKAKGVVDSGIDAAVVSSDSIDVSSFKELTAGMNNIPLGLLLADSNQQSAREAIDLDWDFVIFGLQTPLEAVNKEGLGKVLKIETSLAPGLVRAINELSFAIDAVLIAGESPTVTVEHLLTSQFLAGVLNKPLLIHGHASLTTSELSSLHESGIKGLILPEGTSPKAFAELKKLIGSLPKIPKRKTRTGSVLLPQIGIPEARVEKADEDEEEEDI